MNEMLTSFFVRFTANITSSEFEELKKIAKRIEKVKIERKERTRDSYILIGNHWVIIATYEERLETEMHQILLPCNPEIDKVCIDESLTDEIASETDWVLCS
jgi:type IV secretory pathway component VirB8